MNNISRLFFTVILLVVFSCSALAETEEKGENKTDGIRHIRNEFFVFPENKIGNTLYRNKERIVSKDNLILIDIIEAPGGYIFYGTNESVQPELGFIGDPTVKFETLEGGFYQLTTAKRKIRKIYRLTNNREIQSLLPKSNTASGLIYNKVDKAAFFHIAKGETVETEEGKLRYLYTFKIHIVKNGIKKIIHLPELIGDYNSKLILEWKNKDTIQYKLSNNRLETVVIK